jgi:hypothetical protein
MRFLRASDEVRDQLPGSVGWSETGCVYRGTIALAEYIIFLAADVALSSWTFNASFGGK